MSVIFILIPLSILLAASFLAAFIWAVRSGQYDDTSTPSLRLLMEDRGRPKEEEKPFSGDQTTNPS
jgi:cbb3-type cytochrome oxidase maturation protein